MSSNGLLFADSMPKPILSLHWLNPHTTFTRLPRYSEGVQQLQDRQHDGDFPNHNEPFSRDAAEELAYAYTRNVLLFSGRRPSSSPTFSQDSTGGGVEYFVRSVGSVGKYQSMIGVDPPMHAVCRFVVLHLNRAKCILFSWRGLKAYYY